MIESLIGRFTLPAWNAVILVLLGGTFCFAGWKLFSSLRKVYGAIVGLTIGLLFSHQESVGMKVGSALLSTIAGMFLTDVMYLFGLIVTGGLGAALVTGNVLVNLHVEPMLIDVSCGVSLLAGAVLAAAAPEAAMMVVTASLGAMMGSIGMDSLLKGAHTPVGHEMNFLHAGLAALVGLFVQVQLLRHSMKTAVMTAVEDDKPLPTPACRPFGPLNPSR